MVLPTADLAPQVEVGHLGVAGVHPAAYRGRGQPELGAQRGDLLRREAPCEAGPHRRQPGGDGRLGLVHAALALPELRVGCRLRHAGAVEDMGLPAEAVRPPLLAPVAASRPRPQPLAGAGRVLGSRLAQPANQTDSSGAPRIAAAQHRCTFGCGTAGRGEDAVQNSLR